MDGLIIERHMVQLDKQTVSRHAVKQSDRPDTDRLDS